MMNNCKRKKKSLKNYFDSAYFLEIARLYCLNSRHNFIETAFYVFILRGPLLKPANNVLLFKQRIIEN